MRVKIQSRTGHKIIEINRRRAIRERCQNCTGWLRNDIHNCPITECPLYPFRSGKGRQDAKARARSIRNYCLWCMAGKRAEIAKCSSPNCPLYCYRNSKLDRSTEIKPISKKGLIEGDLDNKIQNEGQSMHKMNVTEKRHMGVENLEKKEKTKSSTHPEVVDRSKKPEAQADSSGSIDGGRDLKPKSGSVSIDPSPDNRTCDCCGRHIDELMPFGKAGDPLVGDFEGALLVKTWRRHGPYDEESEQAVKEAWESYEHDGYETCLDWLINKYGKERGERFYYTAWLYDLVGSVRLCRDCIVLDLDEYFEKFAKR